MARKTSKRPKSKSLVAASPLPVSRREILRRMAGYAVGGAVVLGGGTAFAVDFRKKLKETDLTALGMGRPAIVQIHDPQCSQCAALQKQTRKALRAFDRDSFVYRVANIRSTEGAAFQAATGLPHVTLVLLDGSGMQQHVVRGVTPAAQLIRAFETHLGLPTKS